MDEEDGVGHGHSNAAARKKAVRYLPSCCQSNYVVQAFSCKTCIVLGLGNALYALCLSHGVAAL